MGALKHTMISRLPFPNCRSSVIGLAIAGNPENDGTCRLASGGWA
jgi:hypothetical protein